jgi:hypothetical protein
MQVNHGEPDDELLSACAKVLGWQPFHDPYPDQPRFDITLAVGEALAWLEDHRRLEPRHHRAGWSSILRDLALTIDHLGPHLTASLAPRVQQARLECDRGFAQVAKDRTTLRAHLLVVADQLAERSALHAAWLDFLDLFQDTSAPAEDCLAARTTFWNVAERSGRNRHSLSDSISGVLRNDGLRVQLAMLELGDIAESDLQRSLKHAEMTAGERLLLLERLLLNPPAVHQHVVWHAFTRAAIDTMYTQLGDLTLYNGRWLVDVTSQEDTPPWVDLPSELHDPQSMWRMTTFPDGNDFVLARTDLGRQSLSDAPQAAAEAIDAMVELAKYRAGRRHNWTRLDGHLHAIDGRLASGTMHFGEASPDWDVTPSLDAVIDELQDVADRAGGSGPFRNNAVRIWSETLQSWRDASVGHNAGAVLVGIRVLDSVASHTQMPDWESYVKRYLQWSSVRQTLLRSIQRSTELCLNHDFFDESDRSVVEARENLRRRIVTFGHKMTYFDYIAAIAELEALVELSSPHAVGGRMVRHLTIRLRNSEASQTWIQSVRDDWSARVSRLARVRDALAHGGPTTRESVSEAARFTSGLVGKSLNIVFDAVLNDHAILACHDEFREDQAKWRQRLRSGADLVPALFPS